MTYFVVNENQNCQCNS